MTSLAPDQLKCSSAALAEAADALLAAGHGPITEVTLIKSRAWSTVWRITSKSGEFYCKAAGPGFEREVLLLPRLAALCPKLLPDVVTQSDLSGWLLVADAGGSLRNLLVEDRSQGIEFLSRALGDYACLQIDVSKVPEIARFAVGASADALATQLEALISDSTIMAEGGASADDQLMFRQCLPLTEALVRALVMSGLPDTIDHGDLHANNIMISGDRACVIDWGDAVFGHPYPSLAITLDTTRELLGALPEAGDLTSAYLAPWREAFPQADHDRTLAAAIALRPLYGALLWRRGYHAMRDADRQNAAGWVVTWLRRFCPSPADAGPHYSK